MFPSQLGGAFGLPVLARRHALTLFTLLVMLLGASGEALAHAVAEGEQAPRHWLPVDLWRSPDLIRLSRCQAHGDGV